MMTSFTFSYIYIYISLSLITKNYNKSMHVYNSGIYSINGNISYKVVLVDFNNISVRQLTSLSIYIDICHKKLVGIAKVPRKFE